MGSGVPPDSLTRERTMDTIKLDRQIIAGLKAVASKDETRRNLLQAWTEKGGVHASDGHCALRWQNGAGLEDGYQFDARKLPAGDAEVDLEAGTAIVKGGTYNVKPEHDPADYPGPPLADCGPVLDSRCPEGYVELGIDVDVLGKVLKAFVGNSKGPDGGCTKVWIPLPRDEDKGQIFRPVLVRQKRDGVTVTGLVMPCRIIE